MDEAIDDIQQDLQTILNAPNLPDVVILNVGGDMISMASSTLLKQPTSLLARMITSHYCGHSPCSDSEGQFFLDLDPQSFRVILNLLRGYRSIPIHLLDSVRNDAHFLGLSHILPSHTPSPKFSHAGTSLDGLRITSETVVALLGDFIVSGTSKAILYIEQCERVSIGVVRQSTDDFSSDAGLCNCASYSSNGRVEYSFPNHVEEQRERFGAGSVVSIVLDYDSKRIRWQVGDDTVIVSMAAEMDLPPLSLAVLLQGASTVKSLPIDKS